MPSCDSKPPGHSPFGSLWYLVHLSFFTAVKEKERGRFGNVPVIEVGIWAGK